MFPNFGFPSFGMPGMGQYTGPQPIQIPPIGQYDPYGGSGPQIPPGAFPPGGVSPVPGTPGTVSPGMGQAQAMVPDQLPYQSGQMPGGGQVTPFPEMDIQRLPDPPMPEIGMAPGSPPPPPPTPMEQYLSDYEARTQEIMKSQKRAAMAQLLTGYGSSILGNIGDLSAGMAQGGQHISDFVGRRQQIALLPEARDAEMFEQQLALMKAQGSGSQMPWAKEKVMIQIERIQQDESLSPEQKEAAMDRILGTGGFAEPGAVPWGPKGFETGAGEYESRQEAAEREKREALAKPGTQAEIKEAQRTARQQHDINELAKVNVTGANASVLMNMEKQFPGSVASEIAKRGGTYTPYGAAAAGAALGRNVAEIREAVLSALDEAIKSDPGLAGSIDRLSDEELQKLAEELGI